MHNSPTFNPTFYRTYSRRTESGRESFQDVVERNVYGLTKLGKLNPEEQALIKQQMLELKALPSGRWLWVGGTPWLEKPENYYGAFNCSSTNITDWEAFALQMELGMQGCGTGAVLEEKYISQLLPVWTRLKVKVIGSPGNLSKNERFSETRCHRDFNTEWIIVGDSRQGWVDAYRRILELSSRRTYSEPGYIVPVIVDLSHVRPAGEDLKGFGGKANPKELANLFPRLASILNKAVGRQLTPLECCLLIDEAAKTVVAGNIRRFAGMKQFDESQPLHKQNLWKQMEDGSWQIDPERDALRMSNHTRVYHRKPTEQECIDAVRLQYESGEGAIQYTPEAIARANADLLNEPDKKFQFLTYYNDPFRSASSYLEFLLIELGQDINVQLDREVEHRMSRYGLNPCGEIIGSNFFCNLSEVHLNQLDPFDLDGQKKTFKAAALSVASLLQQGFVHERYQQSREWDPIVGVSFTGLFDFFVKALGVDWLRWWEIGRPETVSGLKFKAAEQEYLSQWKKIVHETVWEYCDRHNLKRPNRCTTVQPAGTKSLLTGASPGWHPPKAQRYIRRITFGKNDPVARACIDYGYSVIPSQSDKDEQGNLLNDPYDPRCTEWLVEIPVEVSWANLPGADTISIEKFSAMAQFDFYMQVQNHYTTHNTSATLELQENEIKPLGRRIYQAIQNDEGYISAALLARFNSPFPRMPFEKIDKSTYEQLQSEVLSRRKGDDFLTLLRQYDSGYMQVEGPSGCDSDKCMMPDSKQ